MLTLILALVIIFVLYIFVKFGEGMAKVIDQIEKDDNLDIDDIYTRANNRDIRDN